MASASVRKIVVIRITIAPISRTRRTARNRNAKVVITSVTSFSLNVLWPNSYSHAFIHVICTFLLDEFQCGDGTCISNTKVCDEFPDCKDFSDELNNCKSLTCSPKQFMCPDRKCIPMAFVCDGDVSSDYIDTLYA